MSLLAPALDRRDERPGKWVDVTDLAVRAAWPSLPSWPRLGRYVEMEVQASRVSLRSHAEPAEQGEDQLPQPTPF